MISIDLKHEFGIHSHFPRYPSLNRTNDDEQIKKQSRHSITMRLLIVPSLVASRFLTSLVMEVSGKCKKSSI